MRYWVEDRVISYAPSISALLSLSNRARESKFDRSLLAFADPAFAAGPEPESPGEIVRAVYGKAGVAFAPLPGTRREVGAISGLFKPESVRVYMGGGATEVAVKAEHLKGYRYLHFATHALIDESAPSRSGIVLSLVNTGTGKTEC